MHESLSRLEINNLIVGERKKNLQIRHLYEG